MTTANTTPVILALDIGSSSVRCSAYTTNVVVDDDGASGGPKEETILRQEPIVDEDNSSRGGRSSATASRNVQVQAIPGACASRKLRLVQPNTGKILVTACLQAVDECLDEVLALLLHDQASSSSSSSNSSHDASYEVVAVGFSCFVMNLVGIDRDGEWVGEEASISYACNTPAVALEVRQLKRELDQATEQQLFQKTGAPIHAAYAIAQLRVLYKEQPASVIGQIAQWQTLPSLCLRRWTTTRRKQHQPGGIGQDDHDNDDDEQTDEFDIPISYSEASWTGLLNYHSCQYETAMLNLLPESCVKALPKLADYDDDSWWRRQSSPSSSASLFLGPLYAQRWPMLQKARFFLGIGDGACANVGSKCWTPNRIACTVGTSAAARICLPLETVSSSSSSSSTTSNTAVLDIPWGLFCYRIDKSCVLVGGALTDGGSVVEWATQLLNLSTNDDGDDENEHEKRTLRNCMDQVKALLEADYDDNAKNTSSNMLVPATMVPFLSGERSTGYRSGATGAMLGLTRDTTPAHFLKASMEGVTLRILAIIQLLIQCIPKVPAASRKEAGGMSASCSLDQERPRIMASGQALEVNGLWRQMIADSTGLNVVWDESTQEGTSRGAASLVARALPASSLRTVSCQRQDDSVDQALVTISSPRGASAKTYWERAAAAQEDLIQALSPMYSKESA